MTRAREKRRVRGASIGERIAVLRHSRAITQVDLAAEARISPSTLSLLENDRTQPHPSTLRKIARALGVPAELITRGYV
jgi:transcriptional regulator with XRE-family HTH domain